jgi:hypothetical protein
MADKQPTGGARPFRFGVVAPLRTDLPTWRDQVRRIADTGYSTLLMPDVQQWQPAPGPTLAAGLADTVTFAAWPGDSRAQMMRLAAGFRAIRDVELALHVPVVGDAVAPFMAPPDTDPAALRAADSLAILPGDPAAATEEILRRREDSGFSYFVIGANAADALAPVVAELTGH